MFEIMSCPLQVTSVLGGFKNEILSEYMYWARMSSTTQEILPSSSRGIKGQTEARRSYVTNSIVYWLWQKYYLGPSDAIYNQQIVYAKR